MPINVGSVSVDVVPDASKFASRLRTVAVPVGDEIGRTVGERISARVRDALPQGLREGARVARDQGRRAGEDFGGSFASTAKRRIEAALKDLPEPRIDADAGPLDRELAQIRADLGALGNVRIGVDLSADLALARVEQLRAQLDELSAKSPDVAVKVDAAAAAAKLAAIQAQVDRLDGDTAHVNVDVDDRGAIARLGADAAGAEGSISALGAAGLALGPAIVPAAAAAAAALAGIAAGALAGLAGIGVLLVAFSGISGAVKELTGQHAKAAAGAARNAATQASAAASVKNAEVSYTDALRSEKRAQDDVNTARLQAKQNIEDLTLAVQDGALAQRQAALDVEAAGQNLAQVLNDPRSTELQREQAQLAYDQAVQQVTDLGVRQERLQAQQKAAVKAGVDGSKQVRDAQAQLVLAVEGVARAQRALAVAQAQQSSAASAGVAKQASALSKLSPAGQQFARFLASLAPIFGRIRAAVQTGLFPGLERGIRALLPMVPAFTRFLGGLASVMGDLFAKAGQALQAPFWQQFFGFLGRTVGPDLRVFVGILGNLARGFAGLFEAFDPVAQQLGKGLLHLTQRFADFAEKAATGKSAGFRKFVDFLTKNGPVVAHALGSVLSVIGKLAVAFAPLGVIVLKVVDAFAQLLQKLPAPVLAGLAAAALGLVAGLTPLGAVAAGVVVALVSTKDGLQAVKDIYDKLRPALLDLWHNVLAGLKSAFSSVSSTIQHNKKQLKELGNFLLDVVKIVVKVAGPLIRASFEQTGRVISGIINIVSGVVRAADAMVGFFGKLPARIRSATHGMWDGIKDSFKAVINAVIGFWNSFVRHLKIPAVKEFGVTVFPGLDIGSNLQIPLLAKGALVTGATPAILGEGAYPEAVLPLSPGVFDALGAGISRSLLAQVPQQVTHRGGDTYNIDVLSAPGERAEHSLPRSLSAHTFRQAVKGW